MTFQKGQSPWNKGKKGSIPWNKGKKNCFSDTTLIHMRNNNKGEGNPMYGKTFTKEHRQSISNALKGNTPWNKGKIGCYSEETLKRMREIASNRSEETRKRLSESKTGENNPNYGKHRSEKTKERISKTKLGVKQPIVKCPYCDKEGGQSPMKQHHFDNCKYK